jgi:hypothetical protein
LAGTSSLTFATTGTLSEALVEGELSGSSSLSLAPAGTLSGVGALTGTSSLTFAAEGTLSEAPASPPLTGTSSLTFTVTGTLDQPAAAVAAGGGGAAKKKATRKKPEAIRSFAELEQLREKTTEKRREVVDRVLGRESVTSETSATSAQNAPKQAENHEILARGETVPGAPPVPASAATSNLVDIRQVLAANAAELSALAEPIPSTSSVPSEVRPDPQADYDEEAAIMALLLAA